MTVHIKVDTPTEHVSTSAHHVSAQEFRQFREEFSSSNKTSLSPYNASFHLNLVGFSVFMWALSRPGVSDLAPTKMSIDCLRCLMSHLVKMYKSFSSFFFFLYLYVNYLKRKQVIKNGMLTKEATSSTVVATSSALLKKCLFSFVVILCLPSHVDTRGCTSSFQISADCGRNLCTVYCDFCFLTKL